MNEVVAMFMVVMTCARQDIDRRAETEAQVPVGTRVRMSVPPTSVSVQRRLCHSHKA